MHQIIHWYQMMKWMSIFDEFVECRLTFRWSSMRTTLFKSNTMIFNCTMQLFTPDCHPPPQESWQIFACGPGLDSDFGPTPGPLPKTLSLVLIVKSLVSRTCMVGDRGFLLVNWHFFFSRGIGSLPVWFVEFSFVGYKVVINWIMILESLFDYLWY